VQWKDMRINIVERRPRRFSARGRAHSQHGRRALVLVDAAEGPFAADQVRGVQQALKVGLKPIVPSSTRSTAPTRGHNEVINEVFDLFRGARMPARSSSISDSVWVGQAGLDGG